MVKWWLHDQVHKLCISTYLWTIGLLEDLWECFQLLLHQLKDSVMKQLTKNSLSRNLQQQSRKEHLLKSAVNPVRERFPFSSPFRRSCYGRQEQGSAPSCEKSHNGYSQCINLTRWSDYSPLTGLSGSSALIVAEHKNLCGLCNSDTSTKTFPAQLVPNLQQHYCLNLSSRFGA